MNSKDPDLTAHIGSARSGSTLFASILKLGSYVSKYMQLMAYISLIFDIKLTLYLIVSSAENF